MKAINTFFTSCLMCLINTYVNCEHNCDRIKQMYLWKDNNYVIESKSKSFESLICEQSNSCCNDFESLLKQKASNDLNSMISSVILPFNTIVNSSETQIKQLLQRILNETHNRTNARFDHSRLREANSRLFSHLWAIVFEPLSQRRVEQYVNRFFNALFVTEFQKEKVIQS